MQLLDRLKEQFKEVKKLKDSNSEHYLISLGKYRAVRHFVLDCELLKFKDVELMEFEIDSSF
jgi:hypothetical protein